MRMRPRCPGSQVAALLAINRLCAPGSELALKERWYPTTALGDLLGIEEGKINDTRLYRCLDRMLPYKTKLEQHLKQRYGELFAAEFDMLLYDLTSTYVEGAAAQNPMMHRGYSRDHRPDCEQMVIALIVNREGFPLSHETFDGNQADVSTMETILRMIERKYGKARRLYAIDRSGAFVPSPEERAFDSAPVSSERAPSEGPRDGGLSRLCALGDAEASAQTPAGDAVPVLGQRQRKSPVAFTDEGARAAVYFAECRHRAPYY